MTWQIKGSALGSAASSVFGMFVILGLAFQRAGAHPAVLALVVAFAWTIWEIALGPVYRVTVSPDGRVEMTAPFRTRRLLATDFVEVREPLRGPQGSYVVQTTRGRLRLQRRLNPSAFSLFEELRRQNPALAVDV